MKYELTERARADYVRLAKRERELFKTTVKLMNDAYDHYEGTGTPHWPRKLRVSAVRGAPGLWEVTGSFAGPDGRATFEYIEADQGRVDIRWRRIGGHAIFNDP